MTSPVFLDAPPAASSHKIPANSSRAHGSSDNPSRADEFRKLLDSAADSDSTQAVTSSENSKSLRDAEATRKEASSAGTPVTAESSGTANADENARTNSEREGDGETTRSVVPELVLDSTPDADTKAANATVAAIVPAILMAAPPVTTATNAVSAALETKVSPIDATKAVVTASTGAGQMEEAPVEEATGAKLCGVVDPDDGKSSGRTTSAVRGRKGEGKIEDESGTALISEVHVADVTSVSGGETDDASPDGDGGEGSGNLLLPNENENPDCVLRLPGGDSGKDTGPAAVQARPLDRHERSRIVHDVIDRVSKHVESLAIARSKEPLRIQLEPADLGRIVVEVSREANGLVAEMSASDPRVAETLDRHRSELAAGLATRGHAEAKITVQASANTEMSGFDLRRESGQSASQQHSHQAQAQRNLQFSGGSMSNAHPIDRPRLRQRATGLDLEI